MRIALAVPGAGVFSAISAAEDLGFYRENGVMAEVTAYRGGAAAQEALVAGAADLFTGAPLVVALAVKKGVKEKIVAVTQARPTGWHIMVIQDSPVRSFRDLAGKKVGITVKGSATDYYALWAAAKAGVTIQTIPVGGGGIAPALKGKQVDAAVVFAPVSFRLMLAGEARSLVDLGKEIEFDVWSPLVATQKFIDEQPDLLRRTLKAIYKATRHMQQNREYALKYLKAYTKEDDRVVETDYEVVVKDLSPDGMIRREWLEASLALVKTTGITDLPKIEEFFTDRFIPVRD